LPALGRQAIIRLSLKSTKWADFPAHFFCSIETGYFIEFEGCRACRTCRTCRVAGPAARLEGGQGHVSTGTTSWQQTLERTVTGLGYDLVDVERSAGGLLRVTIDRLPGQGYSTGAGEFVLVEDCEVVTRQLQYVLEVEAVDYARLEVSSPGLDRPLKKPADWQRFAGAEVEITLRAPFQGRKKWRGVLEAVPGEGGAYDGNTWRLLLPDLAPTSRTAVKRAAKAATAGQALGPAPRQALDFLLDEVREARLVPVVDFKGRRGGSQEPGWQDEESAPEAEKMDGGQD
jgi:ribosome maturation factor RimP